MIATWHDWRVGPWIWNAEPDRLEWSHRGLACLAWRNDFGAWCGYVRVPSGHPWHGSHVDEPNVDVHGGLTFAGGLNGRDGFFLGFDCLHAGDLAPGLWRDGDYRDLPYVRGEIERLAAQVAAEGRDA